MPKQRNESATTEEVTVTVEDFVERARELIVTLEAAAHELTTLIGPIWNERDGLRRENERLREERPECAEWYISACLTCPYSEHTPSPNERCPNDGSVLLRLPGLASAWRIVELARLVERWA